MKRGSWKKKVKIWLEEILWKQRKIPVVTVRVRDRIGGKTKPTAAAGVGLERNCEIEVWTAKIILP